jgi:hypothetical protein
VAAAQPAAPRRASGAACGDASDGGAAPGPKLYPYPYPYPYPYSYPYPDPYPYPYP